MQDCLLVDTEWQICSAVWQQLFLGSFSRTDGSPGAVCLILSSSQLSQHSLL